MRLLSKIAEICRNAVEASCKEFCKISDLKIPTNLKHV